MLKRLKWVNCMSPSSSVSTHVISLTGALTNMKLCREIKLCDPTNNVMFKSM